jgi:hypothetical protein
MKLVFVDTSGEHYYLAVKEVTPEDAQAAIELEMGLTFKQEGWDPVESADIREVLEDEARKTVCRNDGGDPDTDMWTAFQERKNPGIVASSDF